MHMGFSGIAPSRTMPLIFCLVFLSACNLGRPAPTLTPVPTATSLQVQILSPPHNQRVIEGVVFDIEILASDPMEGIERVELYVDEQLMQSSVSESGSVGRFRVTMNWFAKDSGWHKFAVIAYRPDGTASHPHIIALEVIPPG